MSELRQLTLWAGDLAVSRVPCRMITVLGSCVAVCLHDPRNRWGGMNHFMLPTEGINARHGPWAIEQLVQRLMKFGSRKEELIVKLFGGGAPLSCADPDRSVGAENVRTARRVLMEMGFSIAAQCVGTPAGMKIVFESWTGTAWVKKH